MPLVTLRAHLKIGLVLFLLAHGVVSAGQSDRQFWEVKPGISVGAIGPETSKSELEKLFGADNVRHERIFLEGEYSVPGAVVFPDDAAKRIEIVWKQGLNVPFHVIIKGRVSMWRTSDGISLGTTLKELEALNGSPFVLGGFAWDGHGITLHCSGGKLTELGLVDPSEPSKGVQGSSLRLYLTPEPEFQQTEAYSEMTGGFHLSSNPAMQLLNPYVYLMKVYFDR